MTARLALAAAAATLAFAGPAQAAVDIGSPDLGTPSESDTPQCAPPCIVIQDQLDGDYVETPPGSWVVTKWAVRSGNGTLALRVLRDRDGVFEDGEIDAFDIAASADQNMSPGGDVVRTFNTRLPTEGSDYIGITYRSNDAKLGFLIENDGDDNSYNDTDTGGFGSGFYSTQPTAFARYQYRATLEPDADGDEHGDETQDGCPSDGSTQGACPPPPPPPPPPPDPFASVRAKGPPIAIGARKAKASKKGVVSVPVRNLSPLDVTGTVTLTRKGKKVASKRYGAVARSTKRVALKLSRSAFRSLKRKRKLKLGVKTTARAAQGRTTTKTSTVTVKAPPKPRKKKRRRSTGGGGGLDGSYTGPDGVKFKVVNGGRQIRKLQMPVVTSCFTFPAGIQLRVMTAIVEKIPVAASGKFSGTDEPFDGYKTEYSGTLRNGRVQDGFMRLRVSNCSGRRDWTAKRG